MHEYIGNESYIAPIIESMSKHNKGELIKDLTKITSYEMKALNGSTITDSETDFAESCFEDYDMMFETIDGIDFIVCPAWNGNAIMIDVNGYKNKPNTNGRDIFYTEDLDSCESTGNLWAGNNGGWKYGCSSAKEHGYNCAGRLIEEGRMNY